MNNIKFIGKSWWIKVLFYMHHFAKSHFWGKLKKYKFKEKMNYVIIPETYHFHFKGNFLFCGIKYN